MRGAVRRMSLRCRAVIPRQVERQLAGRHRTGTPAHPLGEHDAPARSEHRAAVSQHPHDIFRDVRRVHAVNQVDTVRLDALDAEWLIDVQVLPVTRYGGIRLPNGAARPQNEARADVGENVALDAVERSTGLQDVEEVADPVTGAATDLENSASGK